MRTKGAMRRECFSTSTVFSLQHRSATRTKRRDDARIVPEVARAASSTVLETLSVISLQTADVFAFSLERPEKIHSAVQGVEG